jgi:hypothetical protein
MVDYQKNLSEYPSFRQDCVVFTDGERKIPGNEWRHTIAMHSELAVKNLSLKGCLPPTTDKAVLSAFKGNPVKIIDIGKPPCEFVIE